MRRFMERAGKITVAGLAAGLGASACSGAQLPSSVESIMAQQIAQLPNAHIIKAENDNVIDGGLTILPNGTMAVMFASYETNGTSTKLSLSEVDGIGVTVYPPSTSSAKNLYEAEFNTGIEVNGTWDAYYYQQDFKGTPYSTGEREGIKILTQMHPNSSILSKDNPTEAKKIYDDILVKSEALILDALHNHNATISHNELQNLEMTH
jgi:hypothetical protein